ncbi:outer protein P, partial [Xanthomonas bromi]
MNRASTRLHLYNHLVVNVAPRDSADTKALEARLNSGASALESARQGLQALSDLKMQRRMPLPDIQAHENQLVSSLGQAAAMNYVSCEKLIDQKLEELGSVLDDSSDSVRFDTDAIRLQQPEPWLALRDHLLNAILALEEVFRRIKSPMTDLALHDSPKAQLPIVKVTMGSCHSRMQTVRGVLYEIYSRKLSHQARSCGLPQVLDRLRALDDVEKCMNTDVRKAFTELIKIHIECYLSTEHSLTSEKLASYKNLLAEYAEIRGRAGIQLCVDAAAL